MIDAKIICDSVSPAGHRLTTMQLRYPKFIHGELMTHRKFSRNASSSRAIPTSRLIDEVRNDALRAAPVFWGKNQSGMSAREELDDTVEWRKGWTNTARQRAQQIWQIAALNAADNASKMMEVNASKETVNRLLEPFSHINVIVSATDYDNFFGLRLHTDAQPEMRALAGAMWEARKASTPRLCHPGDNWHLPFFEPEDWDHLLKSHSTDEELNRWFTGDGEYGGTYSKYLAIRVSVARCARVSYLSFDTGKRSTVEEDLKLYDRLMGAQPLHASPAEHQATPDSHASQLGIPRSHDGWSHRHEWGNFTGWRQYRKMLPNEAVAPLPEGYSK